MFKKQRGFSIMELMIGIAVLAVLGAIAKGAYNGTGAKAQSLLTSMQEFGGAAERYRLDTSCYPSSNAFLLQRPSELAVTTGTWCGSVNASKQWNGPYMEPIALDDNSRKISLPDISSDTSLTIAKYTSVGTAVATNRNTPEANAVPAPSTLLSGTVANLMPKNTHTWFIVAEAVPYEIALEVMRRCNGDESGAGSAAAAASGTEKFLKCSLGADADATAAADNAPVSVWYNFKQTRAS